MPPAACQRRRLGFSCLTHVRLVPAIMNSTMWEEAHRPDGRFVSIGPDGPGNRKRCAVRPFTFPLACPLADSRGKNDALSRLGNLGNGAMHFVRLLQSS